MSVKLQKKSPVKPPQVHVACADASVSKAGGQTSLSSPSKPHFPACGVPPSWYTTPSLSHSLTHIYKLPLHHLTKGPFAA